MDLYSRKTTFHPLTAIGRAYINKICQQYGVWCSVLVMTGGKFEKQTDSYKIKLICKSLAGAIPVRNQGYGAQYVWIRIKDGTKNKSWNFLEP